MPKIPLLVTPSIPDISPALHVRRQPPATAGALPSTRRSWRVPTLESIQECAVDNDPPSLPEINRLKAAVVRNKVSDGLSYLLPTDKSRMSITSAYRVNLKSLFQEPYSSLNLQTFNEEKVQLSASAHLKPNFSASTPAGSYATLSAHSINAASSDVYGKYKSLLPRSAGLPGTTSGHYGATAGSMRSGTRSAGVQNAMGSAEIALKEQVESILESCCVREVVQGGEADAVRDRKKATGATAKHVTIDDAKEVITAPSKCEPEHSLPREATEWVRPREFRGLTYTRKSSSYATHADLLNAPVPKLEPPIPVRHADLSPTKVQDIWNWLTNDFHMTQFEHFINVCS